MFAHSFTASRKGVPKGQVLMPDGRKWTEVCDVCGEGLDTSEHRAATTADQEGALLEAIEEPETGMDWERKH